LILALPRSGAALFATFLAQLPRTVAVPRLLPGALAPTPDDLADVPRDSNVVLVAAVG